MIKIYAHKIDHQSKNRYLFEILITLYKENKNKSYSLFIYQSNIKWLNWKKNIKELKTKKKPNLVSWLATFVSGYRLQWDYIFF